MHEQGTSRMAAGALRQGHGLAHRGPDGDNPQRLCGLRENYKAQLIAERLTGCVAQPSFTNAGDDPRHGDGAGSEEGL
jgi:hypothetical protein